jgi:CSLREA domain-containing protein
MNVRQILVVVLVAALPAPGLAGGGGIVVNTTADGADPNPGDAVCDGDAVQNGNQCTLRAAVQTANAIGGANTITLPAGLYELTLKRDTELGDEETGDLDVTSAITIVGAGSDACDSVQSSCIDAKGAKDRVFDVSAAGDLVLQVLAMRGGKAPKDDENASQAGEVSGGCIRVEGDLETDDVLISRCSSPDDGGCIGLTDAAEGALGDTTLESCKAKDGGGAIEGDGAALELERVTISGSSASDDGGAIEVEGDAVLDLTNVTLSGNKAKEGGAIEAEDGATVTLNNVTIAGNKAGDGASIHVDGLSTVSTRNSILASKKGNDCSGGVTSLGNNLDGGTSCGFAQAGDQSGVDPLLEDLADNGGEVPTHALQEGSPAIDRGDDASCEDEDARVVDRIDVNGVGTLDTECDVGAFEFQPAM